MISHGYVQWAWNQTQVTATQKLVLLAIACQCDDHGRTHARRSTISKRCGIHKSGLSRHLKALSDAGLVELHPDGPIELSAAEDELQNRNTELQNRNGRVAKSQPPPAPPNKDSATTSGTDTPYSPPQAGDRESEPGFEEWWEVYPRKVGKRKAEKLWNRLRKSGELPPVEEVVAATVRQRRSSAWEDPKFIPHPTTWLERGGWADEVAAYREVVGYDGELHRVLDTP